MTIKSTTSSEPSQQAAEPEVDTHRAWKTLGLTGVAMMAFAWNSILCRLALRETELGAIPFTWLRVVAGAVTLAVIVRMTSPKATSLSLHGGNGWGAVSLLGYALGFSIAYQQLPSGLGALILFGAVQVTMIGYGWHVGQRLNAWQSLGFGAAVTGLVYLLWPGNSSASWQSLPYAGMMLIAGISWGVYSLLARTAGPPTLVTATNFYRAAVLMMILVAFLWFALPQPIQGWELDGVIYAVLSGSLTSGIGYAIWYQALKGLSAPIAATVQLSVPILVAGFGWWVLNEMLTLKHAVAAILVLGGVALVIQARPRR